jgi:putative hemolysin
MDLHADSIGFLRVALNSAKISGYRNDQVYPEGDRGARSGVALEKKARCEKCGGELAWATTTEGCA